MGFARMIRKKRRTDNEKVRDVLRRLNRGRDACEICFGERGGEPGNENIIDGQVMCDYCHYDYMKVQEKVRVLSGTR